MEFHNEIISDQTILLDSNKFTRCVFKKCRMQIAGISPFILDTNTFDGCSWEFVGVAANSIKVMSALYAQGGEFKSLVEQTFENIRKGNDVNPEHGVAAH